MSAMDLALEGKRKEVRLAVRRFAPHLRPSPTCVDLRAAAASLGLSMKGLKWLLRARRVATFRLDGERMLPLCAMDALRR